MVGFLQRKVRNSSFDGWGQFSKPGTSPEPTDFKAKIAKTSLPAKSCIASEKAS
jgi:hypothetical protein